MRCAGPTGQSRALCNPCAKRDSPGAVEGLVY